MHTEGARVLVRLVFDQDFNTVIQQLIQCGVTLAADRLLSNPFISAFFLHALTLNTRASPPLGDPVLVPVPSEVLLLADEAHELGPAFLESVLSKLEVIALRVAASVVREPIHVQFVDERREWLREEVQRLR